MHHSRGPVIVRRLTDITVPRVCSPYNHIALVAGLRGESEIAKSSGRAIHKSATKNRRCK